jgi:hypothetical protein
MYAAPWYLVMFAFFISVAFGITLGFRKGKVICKETIAKRKAQGDKDKGTMQ